MLNDQPPLVPAKGATRTAALRFLGLKPETSDVRAHAVIRRWMERDDPRFEQYYDRFVEPFEPITRERAFVDPARLQLALLDVLSHPGCDEPRRALIEDALTRGFDAQIDLLMNHPAFEGAVDLGEIADSRVRYRWTFEQLAARVAAAFKITHTKIPTLAAVLVRVWNVDWSDDPVEIVAGVTGKATAYTAARRELKNLLRRSLEKGAGRPRGGTAAPAFSRAWPASSSAKIITLATC